MCLIARPEVIARRVSALHITRPKLTEGNCRWSGIIELMEERRTAYARAAFTIDTSDLSSSGGERVLRERKVNPAPWRTQR